MKSKNIILVVFLTLFCFCASENIFEIKVASASEESDFSYQPCFGDITITGYKGDEAVIEIPQYINGWPVVAVSDGAFYNNDLITDVTIHGGWEYRIGNYAFSDCDRLNRLTINCGGARVTIGNSAFCDCDSLTIVNLPVPDILHIGVNSFRHCDSLACIVLSTYRDTETVLSDHAFADCKSLAHITFPTKDNGLITSLGIGVFSNSDALRTTTITNRVVCNLPSSTFSACDSLEAILFDHYEFGII